MPRASFVLRLLLLFLECLVSQPLILQVHKFHLCIVLLQCNACLDDDVSQHHILSPKILPRCGTWEWWQNINVISLHWFLLHLILLQQFFEKVGVGVDVGTRIDGRRALTEGWPYDPAAIFWFFRRLIE
ncbi:hypothetical protein K443DRAFT_124372 [Laccaria amethystina LaAM-08-1]|uniref:Unplaced genomic scaffold K443scaffold_180, whole genome shotgun sequence n=1 Tax=Laccaria amethystina LaAM-08-1 TaxID=1095629 RepID=A0A0C9X5Q1_9AGAR|nr:hypothetical protein K443DRAFT_124372 [Laccaria amethystina LaAM-08-1]